MPRLLQFLSVGGTYPDRHRCYVQEDGLSEILVAFAAEALGVAIATLVLAALRRLPTALVPATG